MTELETYLKLLMHDLVKLLSSPSNLTINTPDAAGSSNPSANYRAASSVGSRGRTGRSSMTSQEC